jgi:CCR4-NOT transcriptional complex subunit CAF120
MAQQPQYAPPKKAYTMLEQGRSNSGQGMRKLTKTPPLGRTLSGDWTQQAGRQTPDRQQSRRSGINLDSAGASLSAREQMQVSRATGSPLINLAGSKNKQQVPQTGLMGHVAGRERDRAAAKEGRNSVAVQQAIERQQVLATEAQAQAQQQYQMQMQAAQQAQYQQQQDMERQRILTAQAQAQAKQQYQMQMQQQQQMMPPQSQYPPAYGEQPQYSAQSPLPPMQYRNSWQQSPPPEQGYQSPALQRYGASYLQQQQQQQQGRR